ncbi:Zn-dependent hydrolase [Chelativorans sp. M5D2P16]|uniref:Zn-dependent hydrolase n=1 Tax=Chelativorans sp. M5D2P16 TaxID=3095678 RepID=UPI002AC9FDC5|nr:Zn-dependent hydrolase [Chelativorans sp. M5D2P16]MDZ5699271.1 Zn-dependent hydrolase [Chelativorans sp. M5D2P16]
MTQNISALRIDIQRLRRDMEALGAIGRNPATGGLDRVSFSDADMEGRRFVGGLMEAAGLDVSMDGAGNLSGRWQVGDGPAVMLGSHLDSVPDGGMFDGALGVVAGLECVRAMKEAGCTPARPVEVMATAEEEGRFGGMFGAQALTGQVTREWLETARDDAGMRLFDAMRAQGLDPYRALEAKRPEGTIAAFLELHVEQGPVLERTGKPAGIVTGIAGVFNWTVRFEGEANHSGTTPMEMRRDALMGMVDFAHGIPDLIAEDGSKTSRVTIGKVSVEPNFPHTVPGAAVFSLVTRDMDEEVMHRLAAGARRRMEAAARKHGLSVAIDETSWLPPSPCHPDVIAAFRRAADRLGLDAPLMPSGAGHDVQVMAGITRAGLIFVPSVGGISHAPQEWTEWADIEAGTNLLLQAAMELAGVTG